jgi:hypothetical protein
LYAIVCFVNKAVDQLETLLAAHGLRITAAEQGDVPGGVG